MRLLVVEDDDRLAASIADRLRSEGYAVDIATNGVDAEHLGREESYDVVVLDLGLPGRSGLEVLTAWRAAGRHVPILILTARGEWEQKVRGFRAGADDYVTKPFHAEELVARIGALIRRSLRRTDPTLTVGSVTLDEDRQQARIGDGDPVPLTGLEFRLLRYFMSNPGKLLSKSRLAEHVYEHDVDPDSNVIEVYVTRLRRKLPPGAIETRRGQGYVFAPTPKAHGA